MKNIDLKINKKYIFLGVFIILAISLVIGYSYISSDLNLNGTIITKAHTCDQTNLYERISCLSTPDNINSKFLSSKISFWGPSSDTNGKGIYTITDTLDDEYPVHYYRGQIDNNNVKFGGFCWKIVRTSETGGIKLLYNGIYNGSTGCNNTGNNSFIETGKYSENNLSISDVGYKYGKRYPVIEKNISEVTSGLIFSNDVTWDGSKYTLSSDSYTTTGTWESDYTNIRNNHHYTCLSNTTTCNKVYYFPYVSSTRAIYVELLDGEKITDIWSKIFENNNDSAIKTKLETWYKNNLLTNHHSYIEDTIYCNDREIISYIGWNKNYNGDGYHIQFAILGRNHWTDSEVKTSVKLSCNQNDSFTVDNTIGNGKNQYPIGLITSDEATLSGAGKQDSSNSFIYNGKPFFSMTASAFYNESEGNSFAGVVLIKQDGLKAYNVSTEQGIRPMISLKNEISILSGTGTSTDPYVIN